MSEELELRITNAKAIVLSVLSGENTPESRGGRFDEDSVYLSVRLLEQRDPDWLLQQVAGTDTSAQGVAHVLSCMATLRDRAKASVVRPPE